MSKRKAEKLIKAFVDRSLQMAMQRSFFFAKEAGLSFGQLSLMHKIARTGACPVGDVAKQFDVTSAAASQMLDRLVQLGFVQRSEDAGDRRVRLHQLSQKGEDLVRASAHARTKWVDGLISPLTDDQLDKLLPALEILSARIQEFAPHGAHVPFASPAEPAPGNATVPQETSAPETEFAPSAEPPPAKSAPRTEPAPGNATARHETSAPRGTSSEEQDAETR